MDRSAIIKIGIYIAVGLIIAMALAMNDISCGISMAVGLIIVAVIAAIDFGGATDRDSS